MLKYDFKNELPFIQAVAFGYLEVVKKFVYADKAFLYSLCKMNSQLTPVQIAAMNHDVKMVDFLKMAEMENTKEEGYLTLDAEKENTKQQEETPYSKWMDIIAKSRFMILKSEHQKKLKNTGLVFDEKELKEIGCYFDTVKNIKFKKNKRICYSVLKAKSGTLFAKFGSSVGPSSTGKVEFAQNLKTKEFCIVKTIYNDDTVAAREIQFLQLMNQFYDVAYEQSKKGESKISIFMKLAPGITLGEFYSLLRKNKLMLSAKEQSLLLLAILEAYMKLLKNHIFHEDVITESNICIDPITWEATFIDFGHARLLPTSEEQVNQALSLNFILGYRIIDHHITDDRLKLIIKNLLSNKENIMVALQCAIREISLLNVENVRDIPDEVEPALLFLLQAKDPLDVKDTFMPPHANKRFTLK